MGSCSSQSNRCVKGEAKKEQYQIEEQQHILDIYPQIGLVKEEAKREQHIQDISSQIGFQKKQTQRQQYLIEEYQQIQNISPQVGFPKDQIIDNNCQQPQQKSNCKKIIADNHLAKQNNNYNYVELMNFDLKFSIQQWAQLEGFVSFLKDKYQQQIRIKQQDQISEIKFNNKEVLFIHGNIVDQNCDAIINPCDQDLKFNNMNQLIGVIKAVSQFTGVKYQNHLKKNSGSKFKNGDLFIMPLPNHFSHILSISIKQYSASNQDLEQFRMHIKNIFKIAQGKQLQSIALPIFGGGSGGQFFSTVCNIIIQETIEQLSIQDIIKKVIFVEIKIDRIQIMLQVLNNLLYPSQLQKQQNSILYLWQWQRKDVWVDYDEKINQKIDEAFQIYQTDKQQNQIMIIYPYQKVPGTHEVNFNQMLLTDRSIGTKQKIKIIDNQYYFGEQIVNESLNQFLIMQKSINLMIFPIFNKDHKIIFNDKIVQININTNFQRQVRNIPYKSPEQLVSKLCLASLQNFEFNQQVIKQEVKHQNEVIIQITYSDNNKLNEIQQTIKSILSGEYNMEFQWKVLNFLPQDLIDVEQFIKLFSSKIEGQIIFGNSVKICCTCQQYSTIQNYIENAKCKIIYPSTWIPQTQNCIKMELNINDNEYNIVNDLFKQSLPYGKIHQISRIQNQQLYQNFNYEQKKLFALRQNQLQTLERERYLWHGVKSQNPKIIYEGVKEGFDATFSQDNCALGRGIYFAQNASYSQGYAYSLRQNDDLYKGKKVFLLCLVCTGKITMISNGQHRRAPDGYDCGQSGIEFILYGMDVRRAYPAFEIIFE
ncbi:hypothetical protein pb186bvf_000488 [Paramecium bursaria]